MRQSRGRQTLNLHREVGAACCPAEVGMCWVSPRDKKAAWLQHREQRRKGLAMRSERQAQAYLGRSLDFFLNVVGLGKGLWISFKVQWETSGGF